MPYQLADRSNVHRIGQTIAELMLQQGDINAQRAQASGQIWGGLAQNLGQAVGQGVQAYQTQRAEQRQAQAVSARTAKFLKFAQTWDGNPQAAQAAALETYGPTPEAKVAVEGLFAAQRLSQEQRAQTQEEAAQDFEERIGAFGALGRYYEGLPENERQQVFSALYPIARPLVSELVQRAGGDPSALPEETPEWTPEADQAFISMSRQLRGEEQPQTKTRAIEVRNPDGTVTTRIVEDRPGQEFTSAADPQAQEMERLRLEKMRQDVSRGNQPPESRPLTQTAESTLIDRLSRQWTKAIEPTVELGRQAQLMQVGLDAAERGDMAAGSQAVLVTFQKILDPTSVVRESEYARSASGQSLISRIEGAVDKLRRGGAGVPLSELKKFAQLARDAVERLSGGYVDSVRNRLEATADRYNIPHEVVFTELPQFGNQQQGQQAEPSSDPLGILD